MLATVTDLRSSALGTPRERRQKPYLAASVVLARAKTTAMAAPAAHMYKWYTGSWVSEFGQCRNCASHVFQSAARLMRHVPNSSIQKLWKSMANIPTRIATTIATAMLDAVVLFRSAMLAGGKFNFGTVST